MNVVITSKSYTLYEYLLTSMKSSAKFPEKSKRKKTIGDEESSVRKSEESEWRRPEL